MIGLSKNSVILYPHSKEWSKLFEEEKINICNCIEKYIIDIQHVGSTSINDLHSKPIIDIAVGINDFKNGFNLIDDLESIGYHFKGSLGKSKRFFFWKGNENSNTYNLHIAEYGDGNWENQILFRDFINKHSDYRDEYCRLKIELASMFKDDRKTYTERKSEFIINVIQLAKQKNDYKNVRGFDDRRNKSE
jgi:GrpB-like predicted nucleotidyltransferase (UPF0157 family)